MDATVACLPYEQLGLKNFTNSSPECGLWGLLLLPFPVNGSSWHVSGRDMINTWMVYGC